VAKVTASFYYLGFALFGSMRQNAVIIDKNAPKDLLESDFICIFAASYAK